MNKYHIIVYAFSWLVFVFGQAHNSIMSNSNGLTGWDGIKTWLKFQAANLAYRALFSAAFAAWIISTVTAKLQAVGMEISGLSVAAISGFSANSLLYLAFGYVPWLRVEIPDLAPAPNSQIVPLKTSQGDKLQ
jgi:hypothetical protein